MSNRYKGGVISATPPTTTGGESGTASGAWTLEQQMQAQAAGLWPAQPTGPWIEDCFSTWLYTGNSSANTLPNGIDLSGKGGLIWLKQRNAAVNHGLFDTIRGGRYGLYSNTTNGNIDWGSNVVDFGTTGQTINNFGDYNDSSGTYVSWTFRKQPKFFDCVTYTGNGSTQTIAHSLNAAPGVVIIKCTSSTGNWSYLYNFGASLHNGMFLNLTDVAYDSSYNSGNRFSQRPTSTNIFLGSEGDTNTNGATYVAYLFAHNAGGFGLTGTDNVISCGSYSGNGGTQEINLGYEPQWLMVKRSAGGTGGWFMFDTMRGFSMTDDQVLRAQSSDREYNFQTEYASEPFGEPTATGFRLTSGYAETNASGSTYIYIAIRRGPMKVPTSGTSVFTPLARSGTGTSNLVVNTTVLPDMIWPEFRQAAARDMYDRLRGFGRTLFSSSTSAESNNFPTYGPQAMGNTSYTQGTDDGNNYNLSGSTFVDWVFSRAPSFFDEVCYTGTGSATTQAHNLAVVPELMIVKRRSGIGGWAVYFDNATKFMLLNDTMAATTDSRYWNDTSPTSTVFTVGTDGDVNASGSTYVAYLFATCPGVSKVGSYTGTGTTQTINCGFTAGSRFVLIKRTDSTGDWYVWDSARGIVAGNDPYLLLNSTAAEVTSTDYIDTATTGFEISSTAPAAINASGGTFIFLAIA